MKKSNRIFWLTFVLTAVLSLSSQAAFRITRPAKGDTVSPLKPMQRALAMMTEEQLDAFLNQEMVDRMREVTTYPAGIDVEWNAADRAPGGYMIWVADNAEMVNAWNRSVPNTATTLYNLEIGKTY